MNIGSIVALSACATAACGQALIPQAPTMAQAGGWQFYLNSSLTGFGSSTAPTVQPSPGSFGPYADIYSFNGAQWSSTVHSAWSLASTTTTTSLSGRVTLFNLAGAPDSQISTTYGFAQIFFVLDAPQPIAYSANWYSPISTFFGTPGYQVAGSFSPYPSGTMPTLVPMSNTGTLPAGMHTISLIVDLTVTTFPGGFINDAVDLAFDLEARVIPAPPSGAALGLALVAGARRRRR